MIYFLMLHNTTDRFRVEMNRLFQNEFLICGFSQSSGSPHFIEVKTEAEHYKGIERTFFRISIARCNLRN